MRENKAIRRGEIYYANLDPVVGSEEGGKRPILILSNNWGNRYGKTVIAAPITSRERSPRELPTHYFLDNMGGLPKASMVLLEQIRTIDKSRLYRQIAQLDANQMRTITSPLLISLGVKKKRARRKRHV